MVCLHLMVFVHLPAIWLAYLVSDCQDKTVLSRGEVIKTLKEFSNWDLLCCHSISWYILSSALKVTGHVANPRLPNLCYIFTIPVFSVDQPVFSVHVAESGSFLQAMCCWQLSRTSSLIETQRTQLINFVYLRGSACANFEHFYLHLGQELRVQLMWAWALRK